MSYPRWGDRWYKVVVTYYTQDGLMDEDVSGPFTRSVVGEYANMANAVFGALRKLAIDGRPRVKLATITAELLPPKPRRVSKAAYTRHLRVIHEAL